MTKNHEPIKDRLAASVLKRITGEHLTPTPRWTFVFRNYFFWGVGAVAVIIGALAVSAIIFNVANVDWRVAPIVHDGLFSLILAVAPFVWIGALGLFILVGYLNIRHTRHGYRYPLSVIVIGAILTSCTFGVALYAAGVGHLMEESFGEHIPFYHPVLLQKRSWWLAPQKGLLGGTVVSVAPDETSFVLRDFSGATWVVDAGDVTGPDLTVLAHGGSVRVVGIPGTATSTSFHACFVLPWDFNDAFWGQFPPPPFSLASSSHERTLSGTRSDVCKGIRPYQQLRDIDGNGL